MGRLNSAEASDFRSPSKGRSRTSYLSFLTYIYFVIIRIVLRPSLPFLMFHVYVIVSDSLRDRYYIGFSSRPADRLTEHNAGKNPSTASFTPWRFAAIFSFPSEERARRVEPYLKGGSGRAFLRRHILNNE